MRLDEIPAEDFDPLVGGETTVQAGDVAVALVLDRVWRSPYPSGRAPGGFSLFLRGPLSPALGQGIVRFPHPVHGHLDLFMTPIARDADGMRYEIVFN